MIRKVIFILLLMGSACIDTLRIEVPEGVRRLVVDGGITNGPGPYEVKLFYTNPLSISRLTPFEMVSNAQVFIVDDQNQYFALNETKPGVYLSDASELTGEVGRSYFVSVITDEKEYRSFPQRLEPAGEITDVYFEFESGGLPGNSGTRVDALRVYVDGRGIPGEQNLLRWRWTTVHKVRAYPELETIPRLPPIPAPPPCSGYIVQGRQLIQVGECTCCICWSYRYSEEAAVSKNDFVNASVFNKQGVGKIPVTPWHFYDKYHIEVQQLSLSEEAYEFWSLIQKQQSGTTDLFQPNAIKIRGNMYSLQSDTEEVLGFFSVSGVTSKSFFISREEIPYEIPIVDEQVPFSCMAYFENATNVQPSFW